MKGFCKSSSTSDIEKNNFILTPGRYVGFEDDEGDEVSFGEKYKNLVSEFLLLNEKDKILSKKIIDSLNKFKK